MASANSARIAIPVEPGPVRARELDQSTLVLLVVERQVMGVHRVLELAHAIALHGVGDDDDGSFTSLELLRGRVARRKQGREVMAVRDHDMKTEGPKLGVERLERHDLFGATDALDAVTIDEPDEVFELVVRDE